MRHFKLNRLFLIALLSGCSLPPSKEVPIAKVNGADISLGEYKDLLESLKPKEGIETNEKKAELRNLVIRTLVRRAVIATEAEKKGITVSEAELEEGLKKFKDGYSEASFEQQLSDQMIDVRVWKKNIEQSLLIEKLFDQSAPQIPAPSNQELMKYFEKNRHLFQKNASATALHIVVDQKSLADEILSKLKRRPGDFVALAKEHSTGPEAQERAQISAEKGALPEPLDRALFDTKIGGISPVIESPYGFHIFKVISRRPALNLDFQNVRSQISERLQRQRRLEWMDRFEEKLIRMSTIEYNRELIKTL